MINMALNDNIKQLKMKINSDGTLSENILVKYASQLYDNVTINDIPFNGTSNILLQATDIPYDPIGTNLVSEDVQAAISELANSSSVANDGTLTLQLGNPGATNTTISIVNGTGFSANTAINTTYDIAVGPALTALSSLMTDQLSTGFIKKTDRDTFVLDTNTYLTAESDTLQSVTSRGATTGVSLRLLNTTNSTSSSTGSLIVDGGIGVKKDVYVDQNITTRSLIVRGDAAAPLSEIEIVGTLMGDPFNPDAKHASILAPEVLYIDPKPHNNDGGEVIIKGNLTVTGTTTTISSNNLSIKDKDIIIAENASTLSLANGAGIIVSADDLASFIVNAPRTSWLSSLNLELGSGRGLYLNGSTSGFSLLKASAEAGDHTITLPSEDGTLALVSDLPHLMTDNVHTATPWRLFYSNATGAVAELSLGSSGKVLKSNGTEVAPSWENDLDTWQQNTQTNDGYVLAGGTNYDKVWRTDSSGVPGWRNEEFINLSDTPLEYPLDTSTKQYLVRVKSTGDGLEFVDSVDCGAY